MGKLSKVLAYTVVATIIISSIYFLSLDRTPPTLKLKDYMKNKTLELGSGDFLLSKNDIIVTDKSDYKIIIYINDKKTNKITTSEVATFNIRYVVTDVRNNKASIETVITVVDTKPPTLKLKDYIKNKTLELGSGDFILSKDDIIVTDKSDYRVAIFINDEETNKITTSKVATFNIRYVVTDASNNEASVET